MTREWKAGDVAAVHFAWQISREPLTCIRGERGGQVGWVHHRNSQFTADRHPAGPTSARPLVVIDPESTEDIERLFAALHARIGMATLADALREIANPTPPKPDEPQQLAAVVEDVDGDLWTRWTTDLDVAAWKCNVVGRGMEPWHKFTAVKVLSWGWPGDSV